MSVSFAAVIKCCNVQQKLATVFHSALSLITVKLLSLCEQACTHILAGKVLVEFMSDATIVESFLSSFFQLATNIALVTAYFTQFVHQVFENLCS